MGSYIDFNLCANFSQFDTWFHAFCLNYEFPNLEKKYIDKDLPIWRRMDNRYEDFFGSTYEVPLGEYEEQSDEYTIFIYGDHWLSTKDIIFPVFGDFADPFSNISKVNIKCSVADSLYDILSKAYPKATIIDKATSSIGPKDFRHITEDTLAEIFTVLKGNTVDYFIFQDDFSSNLSISVHCEYLQQIANYCKKNNIKYICVASGIDSASLDCTKLITAIGGLSYIIDTDSFLIRMRQVKRKLVMYYRQSYTEDDVVYRNIYGYYDYVYNFIYDSCISRLGLRAYRDKYYISLVYIPVSCPDTYDACFCDGFRRHGSSHTALYGKTGYEDFWDSRNVGGVPYYQYFIGYTIFGGVTNLFMSDGAFLSVIVHTGFSYDLFASEQFKSCCGYEFQSMRAKYADKSIGFYNFVKLHSVTTFPSDGLYDAVAFPMTGAPWLTYTTDDLTYYSEDSFVGVPINFCISRDSYSGTIINAFRSRYGDKVDTYQSIVYGKCASDAYGLYCGGAQAQAQAIQVYLPVTGGIYTTNVGNAYDLSRFNIAMSNSNILYPTKFNNNALSSFRCMMGSTQWENIFLYSQGTKSPIGYEVMTPPTRYAYVLDTPTLLTNYNGNTLVLIATKSSMKSTNLSTTMFPILVSINDTVLDFKAMMCLSDSIFGTLDYLDTGYHNIDGHLYYCVPNGWEGRYFYYGHHFGYFNDTWKNEDVLAEWESIVNYKNMMHTKLIIRLR